MLNFQFPTIEDREWIQPILSKSEKMGSESAFGTIFVWSQTYHTKVCRYKDTIFLRKGEKAFSYVLPAWSKNLYDDLTVLINDAKENEVPFQLWGITKEEMEQIEKVMPNKFDFSPERDDFDYIYHSQDLINLAGRSYHSKRNHLSKFNRMYHFTYEEIILQNIPDCIQIAREWCKLNGGCGKENGLDNEACALRKTFNNYTQLNFQGGLIKIDEKPVAFTIGEEIDANTFVVHFEKALTGYDGLYTAINHEFVSHKLQSYQYVNREEDMGIEGLRKAKLSYKPAILLEKYNAVLK